MSLNWDITAIRHWKAVTGEDQWPVTDALIIMTIPVKMGIITARNWEDFFDRLDTLQREDGSVLRCGDEDYFITREDVRRRIGLKTNMDTVSRRTWLRQRRETVVRRAVAASERRRHDSYHHNFSR
jgi:hypothetical protein